MGLEVVYWQDAHFALDTEQEEDGDFIVRTVGWVTVVGAWVRIVGEQLPDDGERAITRVLRENVVLRVPLAELRETGIEQGLPEYTDSVPSWLTQEY